MRGVIFRQKSQGECIRYAFLNAFLLSGKDVTEEQFLEMEPMLGFPGMTQNLKELGLIKGLAYISNANMVDFFLKRGHKLPMLMYRNNFNSIRYAPYLQDFRGKMNHFVCLIEDCGDRWRYRDQQGPDFADSGNGYILKSDFKNIKVARIIF